MKPKMFVGSSVEGINIAYAVQQNLVYQAEVTVWDQGVFNLSKSALESLVQVLDRSDFGIFVFTPDDIVNIRGDKNRTVRDNVLFELGLFIGRLGKERSFIIAPQDQKELHLPTDLIGMTPGNYESDRTDENYQAATGPACHDVRQAIAKLGFLSKSSHSSQTLGGNEKEIDNKTAADVSPIAESEEITQEAKEPSWFDLFNSGKYEDATKILIGQIEKSQVKGDRVIYETYLGRVKARQNFREGIAYLNDLIKKYPDITDCYISAATVYANNDLHDKAIETLEEGLLYTEEKVWLEYFKASYLADQGKVTEATEVLTELSQEHPDFELAYTLAAKFFKDRGEQDSAVATYETGLRALPTSETLLLEYGLFLSEIKDDEGALTNLRKLVELAPKNSTYLAHLGNIYLTLDCHGLSLESYQKANVIAEEKEEWIISNIGNLHKNRGFYPQAIDYFQQALSLNKDSSYAHERLSTAIEANEEEKKKANDIIKKYRQRKRSEARTNLDNSDSE